MTDTGGAEVMGAHLRISAKPNSRFGKPAFLFGFNRNACSSSSENRVRLQPKILFGFAEIRTELVIGRKRWLFADTPTGAHASAVIYSLIETARANGLEPYTWLR